MELKIIYGDNDLLVVDKPAGIVVCPEAVRLRDPQARRKRSDERVFNEGPFLINELIKQHPELKNVGEPPRYGIVHRLDKDTSGILLVAKNNEALAFFQKQFKNREVGKKYIALAVGNIKQDSGIIESLIGRSPQNRLKQKAYPETELGPGRREAITEYKVLKRFQDYTLLEVSPKTGRKHQIRCHLTHIGHPIAGDKLYGFKNQPWPKMLNRLFLHACNLRVKLLSGFEEEFVSEIAEDLADVLENLEEIG
jgi:23S rRNA pseudouridine1911/1915/1917 synthase